MRGLAPHAGAGNAWSGSAFPDPPAFRNEVERQALRNTLAFDLHDAIGFAMDVRAAIATAGTSILDCHITRLVRYDEALALVLGMAQLDQPPAVAQTQPLQGRIGLAYAQFPTPGIELVEHSQGRALPGSGNCDPTEDHPRQSDNSQSQIRPLAATQARSARDSATRRIVSFHVATTKRALLAASRNHNGMLKIFEQKAQSTPIRPSSPRISARSSSEN